MNFNNIHKIIYTFIAILCINVLSFCQCREQGTPYIQNITPKEYGYESQNFSVIQDSKGIIYIGNVSGVLKYDGENWQLIKIYGVSSLALDDNDRIYVGGYNIFGYLDKNEKNVISYVSLSNKISHNYRHFGYVDKIITKNNEVFFYADDKLYQWDQESIEVINTNCNLFKTNNEIYVNKQAKGLMIYSSGNFKVLPNGKFFKDKMIIDILPYGNNLIIKTIDSEGFYLYNFKYVKTFNTQIDDYLNKNGYIKGQLLPNGNYAIATTRCGLIFINNQGEIICIINQHNGLHDDHINDMFYDGSGNLWLALNNGLSRIEVPSPYTYFGIYSGLNGLPGSIIRHENILYIATSHGLYYLEKKYSSQKSSDCMNITCFYPVKGIRYPCFNFFHINKTLYVNSENGVYKVTNRTGSLAKKDRYKIVIRSTIDTNLYYAGKKNGFTALKITGNTWHEQNNVKKVNYQVRSIAEDNNGMVWLGTEYEGVFLVDLSEGYDENAKVIQFKSGNGLPADHKWIDVYSTINGVLFSTSKGIYRFDKDKYEFYADTLIGIDFRNNDRWVYPVVEDEDNNLWLSSAYQDIYEKETAVAYYMKKARKYIYIRSPFNRIDEFTVETIYPDINGMIWFAGADGLIRFNTRLMSEDTVEYHTLINKISIGKDSIVFHGINIDEQVASADSLIPEFKHKYNSINFEFTYPYYMEADDILYQVFLEGFDKDWSKWSNNNVKEYTNLDHGDYVFRVRAKNVFGKVSEGASYSFSILPPIYKTWYAYLVYLIATASFILMLIKWRSYIFAQEKHRLELIIADRTEELVKQKERAEEIVSNILPKDTAEELKSTGRATRKSYKMVTVLFSDVQGFTKIAEHMNPESLLDELDRFFYQFDMVVEKYNIEKIKTIGDAYMCAGGIPEKNRTNPLEVVMAALEMRQYMKTMKKRHENDWNIRIGIHTGPVIAGVVGTKKITYDIWGDTVNIASRMESSGEVGEINISGLTHEIVKDYFECEHRGKMPVKNKGDIDMYFVKGFKPEMSVNGQRLKPNEKFRIKFQLIRYDDLEEEIMTKLHKGLPKNLYYHNLKHTIDVINQVEIIGREEKVTDEEKLLLKTAALFHDSGFIVGYDDHEVLGINIAREMLPKFGYSEDQIKQINELIYSTRMPPEPKNHLEEIMCDADLDYLGRTDFIPVSQNLFRELYERGKIKEIQEWIKIQINFIENHQYFTETARKLRNVNKIKQLQQLRKMAR